LVAAEFPQHKDAAVGFAVVVWIEMWRAVLCRGITKASEYDDGPINNAIDARHHGVVFLNHVMMNEPMIKKQILCDKMKKQRSEDPLV
jgi:hypothetical protein